MRLFAFFPHATRNHTQLVKQMERGHGSEGEHELDTALHHARHVGPRLLDHGSLCCAADVEQDAIMRAAIFHQHRHVRALALGIALVWLLAIIYQRPAGETDRVRELTAVMLLIMGHASLGWRADLRAAHRIGVAVWLTTVSVAMMGSTHAMRMPTLPLAQSVDSTLLMSATGFLLGVLHTSMWPRVWQTLVFVLVVSGTSTASIVATWNEEACMSASRSGPVVFLACTLLGLLAGQPWANQQRLVYILSQQNAVLQAGKERLAFDYDKQHRENARLRREIHRLMTADSSDAPIAASCAAMPPLASSRSSTTILAADSSHKETASSVDVSLMSSDDETPLFAAVIQSAAEGISERMADARRGTNPDLRLQLRWLGSLPQGPHRPSNYARRSYLQVLHVLRQGRRDPGNSLSLLDSEDVLSRILFLAMGFHLEHFGMSEGPQVPVISDMAAGAARVTRPLTWPRGTGRRGRGRALARGGGRGRGRGEPVGGQPLILGHIP